MRIRLAVPLLLVCGFLATGVFAQTKDIDIPYRKFVLGNGLTVIVHEDHKAPIVAVNMWYHVGSKNEKPGKTGFAHLFEHLMFGGSEHAKGRYIDAMTRIGATDLNGTTNEDRTNYFENRAHLGAGLRAVDGVGPHGAPARRGGSEDARPAARRGGKREAARREPALRHCRGIDHEEHLSRRATPTRGP